MNFLDIIGHERPLGILRRTLVNGTVAHAYLFTGEAGIGKRMAALAFAAAVNCAAPGPDGGCGSCAACRKTASGNHPDLQIMTPESEDEQFLADLSRKEREKASREIKIEQVRQAQERLALRPFEGRKKVLVVDNAESMNTAAANAFLKTLEEPPGETLIILVSSLPQRLLGTIRSRCQVLAFQPLPRRRLAAVLQERRGLTAEDAWFLAALAGGSLGRALEMDAAGERKEREEFFSVWDRLAGMRRDEVLALAEGIAKDRDGFDRLIAMGIERLRDALVLRQTGDERLVVFGGAGSGSGRSLPACLRDLELFTESRRMLDGRVNAQLVAEHLLFSLGRP